MKIQLDDGAFVPVKAHKQDAGWDLLSPIDIVVPPYSQLDIDTGVHMDIPNHYVGMVKTKSSVIRKRILTEGVVDSGYTGSIHVFVNNLSKDNFFIKRGQKIAQIVFLLVLDVDELVEVDQLDDTERGDGGFGSTGIYGGLD